MNNNINEHLNKLEELKKLYESEEFEKHNAFCIAIIDEIKEMLVSKNELLHDVSCSDINCKYEDREKYLWCEKHGTAHKKRHCN